MSHGTPSIEIPDPRLDLVRTNVSGLTNSIIALLH